MSEEEDHVVLVLGDQTKYLQRLASDPMLQLEHAGKSIVFVADGDLQGKSGYLIATGSSELNLSILEKFDRQLIENEERRFTMFDDLAKSMVEFALKKCSEDEVRKAEPFYRQLERRGRRRKW